MSGLRCRRPVPFLLEVLHTQAAFPVEGVSHMADGRDRSDSRFVFTLKPTLIDIVMFIQDSYR